MPASNPKPASVTELTHSRRTETHQEIMSADRLNTISSITTYFTACDWLVIATQLGSTASLAADQIPASRTWIERPWEFRYILKIESPDDYERWRDLFAKELSENNARHTVNIESIFPLTTSVVTDLEDDALKRDRAIGAILITFDEHAEVTSLYKWPHKLSVRLNRIYDLVLTSGNGSQDMRFDLGHWYTGRSDAEIEYIPAICSMEDMDERYKKGFSATSYSTDGNFGCREWGYYLQNDKYPYIDVTSYGKDQFGPYSYIRPVIGWGRFDTPPKPVIGKHGKVWVCLHECPNGEAPGIIPDIAAWAKKNGWPVPKRPKKQPMFPDKEFKRGQFID